MTSKFALVIANTEYEDASFAKLTAPGKDAEEFAQVLRELAAFDDVQILLNAGEGKTRRSIARFFAEPNRDDLLLLYFSGHGVRNDVGHLFLAANDTEINILEASGIPAEFVTNSMNNSRSQRQLLILDCCNSGAFAHGTKSAAAVGKSMGIATAFEGSGFGRIVLTATDATQYAWEGDKVIGNTQKSVFTHFLIEGLKGDADLDGDGRIHVDELYDYTYEQVVSRTPKQTPGKWSYKQQGDIVLRENLKPHEVKLAPLPSELLELLSHPNSSVRKVGIQELITMMDGKHLGLARAAQEKLREIAENDDSLTLRKTASDTLIVRGITLEQSVETLKESPFVVNPAPVEVAKKERKEERLITKPFAAPRISRSLQEFPSFFVKLAGVPRKLVERKIVLPKFDKPLLGRILGISFAIVSIGWAAKVFINNWPAFNSPALPTSALTPNATLTIQPITTRTSQPARTDAPSSTQTSIPPTPTLGIGSSIVSDKDDMTLLYIPAGEFMMGSSYGESNERPVHSVYLDAFWIDQTEVTNAMYVKCVQDTACEVPSSTKSSTRDSYYGNPEFDNYPVINVSWDDAKTYCAWAGRRLPTEAEWEKAARGTDEHKYPWGNNQPNSNLLNNNMNDTTEVGKYPNGASPYDALDMAGNVWEWVEDWQRDTYYANSPTSNPLGPDSGVYRGLRGGSWYVYRTIETYGGFNYSVSHGIVTSWDRIGSSPDVANYYFGFRCAVSATP